ncbi:MAG TPA: hypothetical protein VH333_06720 [Pseudonocardiaceae bacterium]|nr:hypothetical protein [Pseudonocardiaceae bacterium]
MNPAPWLSDVGDLGPFFAVHTHDAGAVASSPWRSMRELVDSPDVLAERVSAVRSHLAGGGGRPSERVAASVAHLGLVARLASPAIGLAVHSGRWIGTDLADLWWQPTLGGAFPLSIGVAEVSGPVLGGAVVELTRAVRGFSVSERVLWGNVASAINGAGAVIRAGRPALAARADAVVARLLALPPLRHTSTRRPDGRFQRLSCCLIYQASPTRGRDNVCGDCVLAPVQRRPV